MTAAKTMKDYVDSAKAQIAEVSINEVTDLLADGYQVLDVREPDEYEKGTIEGAINVPRGVLEAAADQVIKGREELQDRDKKWLILCRSSARSALATVVLHEMGFNDVKNIDGGFLAWKGANKAIEVPD